MLNISIQWLQLQLHQSLPTADVTLGQVISFICLSSRLKDFILLTQPAPVSANIAPDILPPVVIEFLAECCKLTEDEVEGVWDVLKAPIWEGDTFQDR
jgi:hypothetical protein